MIYLSLAIPSTQIRFLFISYDLKWLNICFLWSFHIQVNQVWREKNGYFKHRIKKETRVPVNISSFHNFNKFFFLELTTLRERFILHSQWKLVKNVFFFLFVLVFFCCTLCSHCYKFENDYFEPRHAAFSDINDDFVRKCGHYLACDLYEYDPS